MRSSIGLILVKKIILSSSKYLNTSSANVITNINFSLPIIRSALRNWEKVAIVDRNAIYRYKDIYQKSCILLDAIQNKIIINDERQHRIATLLPNDASYVVTQFSTWMAGHIAVPLYPRHPKTQLEYFIDDSQSSLLITNNELAEYANSLEGNHQVLILPESILHNDMVLECPENSLSMPEYQNELMERDALIIYTSGTTGPPKGVVLSHKNVNSQIYSISKMWEIINSDVVLHCLPLNHVHGIVGALLSPLMCGARVVMEPKFDATSIWSLLASLNSPLSSRINVFMGVPTMYALLIEDYEKRFSRNPRLREYIRKVCIENIRVMISGSSALPSTILEKWAQITGHTLLERYGMTEIGLVLSNPLKKERRPGFVSHPMPGVNVRIARFSLNRSSYEILCESRENSIHVTSGSENESGELLIKGQNVFKHYWNRPEATKEEFTSDGWFCTGDIAIYTEGGFKILGRESVDIIKSGGFKISALEVERELLANHSVKDVVVVGLPDITWGEKVAAVVVSHGSNFSISGLKQWAKDRLPHYQVLSVIKMVEELPRNSMGKVNKKEIIRKFFT